MEIEHPEIVIKQFILETGWGKSYVCKKFNNLFGFRGSNGYFKYKHWTESVEHYKEFQNKKYKGGDYYVFLHKVGYAEAPDYIQILKQNFGKI
jgi:flagellum-specific peptidoglycan hydrolase FlgJ